MVLGCGADDSAVWRGWFGPIFKSASLNISWGLLNITNSICKIAPKPVLSDVRRNMPAPHISRQLPHFCTIFARVALTFGIAAAMAPGLVQPVFAQSPPAIADTGTGVADKDICAAYAAEAEIARKIPRGLLWAIGMIESRRTTGPWPWTLNAGGGLYFDTRKQAARKLSDVIRVTGRANVDIGCCRHIAPVRACPKRRDLFRPDRA